MYFFSVLSRSRSRIGKKVVVGVGGRGQKKWYFLTFGVEVGVGVERF